MFYKLDENNNPVECSTALEWAEWFEKFGFRRIVAKDDIVEYLVTTIFGGIDPAGIDRDPPLLFETMVFKGREDTGVTARYATWSDAAAGHRRTVLRVRNGGKVV